MCSLQEAWGDFNISNSINQNNNHNLINVRNQQMQMDMERRPSTINNQRMIQDNNYIHNQSNQSNQSNDYYSQSNLRRESARPDNDIFRPNYDTVLMSKPPTGNSYGDGIRGIHNKYSREKRVSDKSMTNGKVNLTSNINYPNYINNVNNGKPYVENSNDNGNNQLVAYNTDDTLDLYPVNDNYFNNSFVNNLDDNNNLHNNNLEYSSSSTSQQMINHPLNNMNPTNNTPSQTMVNTTNNNTPSSNTNNKNNNINNNIEINEEDRKTLLQIKKLKTELNNLNSKIKMLESKLQNVENNRPHDVILIIVISLFILFIVDNIFKNNITKSIKK